MTTLKEIHDYLLSIGVTEESISKADCSSVRIAEEIALYAHRNQKREQGEPYVEHPYRVMEMYRELIGIGVDGSGMVNKDLLDSFEIPFTGVQEVAMLHDVLEDTEVTEMDISSIYHQCGLGWFYDMYIKEPLLLITHDKAQEYPLYIAICMQNPTSAMVKMLDMKDNLNMLTVAELGDKVIHRSIGYLGFIKAINDRYHFVEGCFEYKTKFVMAQDQ